MQRTIKTNQLLPIFQAVIAFLLLVWGRHVQPPTQLDTLYKPTVTSVCFGLNAPAVLLRPLIALVLSPVRLSFARWANRLALDEIPFLIVVAAVWYLLDKWLLASRNSDAEAVRANPRFMLASCVIAFLVGAILLYLGVDSLKHAGRWNNPLGNRIEGSLFVLWALTLFSISIKKLKGRPASV